MKVVFIILFVGAVLAIIMPSAYREKAEIRAQYKREVDRCRELGGEPIVDRTNYGPKLTNCYFPPVR